MPDAGRDLRLATIAALVATAGDLGLLWASNAPAFGLAPLSHAGLVAATLAGALAIPLYALGYRAAACELPPPDRRVVVWLGVYGAALGAAVHLATGLIVHFERTAGGAPPDPYAAMAPYAVWLGPLWAVLAVVNAVASLRWARGVGRGTAGYPRTLRFVNPLAVVVAVSALGAPFAWGRAFVVPAAPNVAHVVFFAALAATRRS